MTSVVTVFVVGLVMGGVLVALYFRDKLQKEKEQRGGNEQRGGF